MTMRKYVGAVVCTFIFAALAVQVSAGEEKKGQEASDKMMEEWAKMSAPGEHHAHLNAVVGKWSYVSKWRMSPEAPWDESKGTSEHEWALGKRFVVSKCSGEMKDGMRFEGMGMWGYDNTTKKYTSTWADNMCTAIMKTTGTCDESGKTFTMSGEYVDPMTGAKKTAKSVTKIINNDKYVFEMFDKDEAGKEFKSLEVAYTRIK